MELASELPQPIPDAETDGHLRLLAGTDWPEIVGESPELEAHRAAAETAEQVRLGIVPAHYTATTECASCGPVPTLPGVPAKVESCAWCFNRVADRARSRRAPARRRY